MFPSSPLARVSSDIKIYIEIEKYFFILRLVHLCILQHYSIILDKEASFVSIINESKHFYPRDIFFSQHVI